MSDGIANRPLLEQIQQLLSELRAAMRQQWRRTLPSGDLLLDRWTRAQELGFGQGASIYDSSCVFGDVAVGDDTWIGPFTLLDGSGGLTIGRNCSISAGVQIYTHDSVRWAVSGGRAEYERAPVRIGDCCHIGSQSVVLKGVTIGDHSVVGAGSLVKHDLPPYTVAVGTPCRPIGRVDIDDRGDVQLIMSKESSAP